MNFGEILDQWDRAGGSVYNKDSELDTIAETPAVRRRRLHRKSPDAVIDLHGLTQSEAWNALETFFGDVKNRGLEKVMIIHGKGNHSGDPLTGPGALRKTVRDFLERCSAAGENGYSDAASGGTGSTWVLLKQG